MATTATTATTLAPPGSDILPLLDRIDAPNGAVAAATQLRSRVPIQYPRYFADRSTVPGTPSDVTAPHRDSAMWYKQLHAAYMAGHHVNTAGCAAELLQLFGAENMELGEASRHPIANYGADGSLKPRRIALWLQVNTAAMPNSTADMFLDAISHWTAYQIDPNDSRSVIMRALRTTVVGGADCDEFERRTDPERTHKLTQIHDWAYRVSVRWAVHEPGSSGIGKIVHRTETAQYAHVPSSTDAILADVQQTAVRLVCTHRAPSPKELMATVRWPVVRNSFAWNLASAHQAFANLSTSEPSVTLDAIASGTAAAPLQNTGVVVRLAAKELGSNANTHPSAFHGVLLSFGKQLDQARAFATKEHGPHGLRVPIGGQEEAMGLHMCAVQATEMRLDDLVTLYGPLGRVGQPIHPGGSWVWIESAAIRPVDATLLGVFNVYPCARQSIMPKNAALHESFKAHFAKASKLYTSLDCENKTTLLNKTRNSSFSSTEATMTLVDSDDDVSTAVENDRFLLAALRVDLQSQRTTIGDAYSYLFDIGPPSSVANMLLHAAGRLGVAASLNSVMHLCCDSIGAQNSIGAVVAPDENLRKLADVAMQALVDDGSLPPAKRAKPTRVTSTELIRRMLSTVGLKRGSHVQLARNAMTSGRCDKVVELLGGALGAAGNELTMQMCQEQVARLGDDGYNETHEGWMDRVEVALQRLGKVCIRTKRLEAADFFVLSSDVEDGEADGQDGSVGVRVWRIGAASTFEELCAVARPTVLVLQSLGGFKARITATTGK